MIRHPAAGTASPVWPGVPLPTVPGSLAHSRATTGTWPSAGWSCRDQNTNLRYIPGRPGLGHGILRL
jgi:hypothetical protein